jgi:hypothetical protein
MESSSSENTSSRAAKNAAKKARRKFRHEIAHRMKRIATKRTGLDSTDAQLRSYTRILTDRYMHKVDHVPAKVEVLNQGMATPQVHA